MNGTRSEAHPGDVPVLKTQDLVDWWWNHGSKRAGRYELHAGSWLDRIQGTAEEIERISQVLADPKGTLALWGPSQSGKSTFFSHYIDAGGDKRGCGNALHWDDSRPVRFSINPELGDHDEAGGDLILNPYHENSDASGCISRFYLPDDPAAINKTYPVEIRVCSRKHVLHALAVGYAGECAQPDEDNGGPPWTASKIDHLITQMVPTGGDQANIPAEEAKTGLAFLRDVVDVLEVLAESSIPRYCSLGRDIKQLRQAILNNRTLASSVKTVGEFAGLVFWDNWAEFNRQFVALCKYLDKVIRELPSGGRIFCDFFAAALLLDIATYRYLAEGRETHIQAVGQLGWKRQGDHLILGKFPSEVSGLTPLRQEFQLLQGIVWELCIPLRREVLESQAPQLLKLLQQADILDFPGVANQQQTARMVRLTAEKLNDTSKAYEFFTVVLKRGKTGSIVASSARNLDIDGFTLLCKIKMYAGRPDQLLDGIDQWWRSLTGYSVQNAGGRDLPLNFVLTFFATLVTDWILNPQNIETIGQNVFGKFHSDLGPLADPRIVTYFTTNYFRYPEGRINVANSAQGGDSIEQRVRKVLDSLRISPDWLKHFPEKEGWVRQGDSVNRCLDFALQPPSGGTDYLVEKLLEDVRESRRRILLREKLAELRKSLRSLLAEALPEDNIEGNALLVRLAAWEQSLDSIAKTMLVDQRKACVEVAESMAYLVRQFLRVDPSVLQPLPLNLHLKPDPGCFASDYLAEQFSLWASDHVSPGLISV